MYYPLKLVNMKLGHMYDSGDMDHYKRKDTDRLKFTQYVLHGKTWSQEGQQGAAVTSCIRPGTLNYSSSTTSWKFGGKIDPAKYKQQ